MFDKREYVDETVHLCLFSCCFLHHMSGVNMPRLH